MIGILRLKGVWGALESVTGQQGGKGERRIGSFGVAVRWT